MFLHFMSESRFYLPSQGNTKRARAHRPRPKTAQCDHWKCRQGDVCVFIYSSHLGYEWTTSRLPRPAHILRNQPTTGYLPVRMCSQCTLSAARNCWNHAFPRAFLIRRSRAVLAHFASTFFHCKMKKMWILAVDDRFCTFIFTWPLRFMGILPQTTGLL